MAAALPCDALPSDQLTTTVNIDNAGSTLQSAPDRGALRINDHVVVEETAIPARVPTTTPGEGSHHHQAAIAELSAALTLLYAWSTLTQPLPASLHDQVKRAFVAAVTPSFERPYAERVAMYEQAVAEQKAAPPPPKKAFKMNYRGFVVRHTEGAEPHARTDFQYLTADGSICGFGSSVKVCKKMIDQHFVEIGQSQY